MKPNKKTKVFLGGTCNGSTWRDELIPKLKIDYFNPVVKDWTPECQAEEERQKNEECMIHLYVITPQQKGVFSIAEMIESACNNKVITVIYIQYTEDADKFYKDSWKAVEKMAQKHGAYSFISLDSVARFLNSLRGITIRPSTDIVMVFPSNGFETTTTLNCLY